MTFGTESYSSYGGQGQNYPRTPPGSKKQAAESRAYTTGDH